MVAPAPRYGGSNLTAKTTKPQSDTGLKLNKCPSAVLDPSQQVAIGSTTDGGVGPVSAEAPSVETKAPAASGTVQVRGEEVGRVDRSGGEDERKVGNSPRDEDGKDLLQGSMPDSFSLSDSEATDVSTASEGKRKTRRGRRGGREHKIPRRSKKKQMGHTWSGSKRPDWIDWSARAKWKKKEKKKSSSSESEDTEGEKPVGVTFQDLAKKQELSLATGGRRAEHVARAAARESPDSAFFKAMIQPTRQRRFEPMPGSKMYVAMTGKKGKKVTLLTEAERRRYEMKGVPVPAHYQQNPVFHSPASSTSCSTTSSSSTSTSTSTTSASTSTVDKPKMGGITLSAFPDPSSDITSADALKMYEEKRAHQTRRQQIIRDMPEGRWQYGVSPSVNLYPLATKDGTVQIRHMVAIHDKKVTYEDVKHRPMYYLNSYAGAVRSGEYTRNYLGRQREFYATRPVNDDEWECHVCGQVNNPFPVCSLCGVTKGGRMTREFIHPQVYDVPPGDKLLHIVCPCCRTQMDVVKDGPEYTSQVYVAHSEFEPPGQQTYPIMYLRTARFPFITYGRIGSTRWRTRKEMNKAIYTLYGNLDVVVGKMLNAIKDDLVDWALEGFGSAIESSSEATPMVRAIGGMMRQPEVKTAFKGIQHIMPNPIDFFRQRGATGPRYEEKQAAPTTMFPPDPKMEEKIRRMEEAERKLVPVAPVDSTRIRGSPGGTTSTGIPLLSYSASGEVGEAPQAMLRILGKTIPIDLPGGKQTLNNFIAMAKSKVPELLSVADSVFRATVNGRTLDGEGVQLMPDDIVDISLKLLGGSDGKDEKKEIKEPPNKRTGQEPVKLSERKATTFMKTGLEVSSSPLIVSALLEVKNANIWGAPDPIGTTVLRKWRLHMNTARGIVQNVNGISYSYARYQVSAICPLLRHTGVGYAAFFEQSSIESDDVGEVLVPSVPLKFATDSLVTDGQVSLTSLNYSAASWDTRTVAAIARATHAYSIGKDKPCGSSTDSVYLRMLLYCSYGRCWGDDFAQTYNGASGTNFNGDYVGMVHGNEGTRWFGSGGVVPAVYIAFTGKRAYSYLLAGLPESHPNVWPLNLGTGFTYTAWDANVIVIPVTDEILSTPAICMAWLLMHLPYPFCDNDIHVTTIEGQDGVGFANAYLTPRVWQYNLRDDAFVAAGALYLVLVRVDVVNSYEAHAINLAWMYGVVGTTTRTYSLDGAALAAPVDTMPLLAAQYPPGLASMSHMPVVYERVYGPCPRRDSLLLLATEMIYYLKPPVYLFHSANPGAHPSRTVGLVELTAGGVPPIWPNMPIVGADLCVYGNRASRDSLVTTPMGAFPRYGHTLAPYTHIMVMKAMRYWLDADVASTREGTINGENFGVETWKLAVKIAKAVDAFWSTFGGGYPWYVQYCHNTSQAYTARSAALSVVRRSLREVVHWDIIPRGHDDIHAARQNAYPAGSHVCNAGAVRVPWFVSANDDMGPYKWTYSVKWSEGAIVLSQTVRSVQHSNELDNLDLVTLPWSMMIRTEENAWSKVARLTQIITAAALPTSILGISYQQNVGGVSFVTAWIGMWLDNGRAIVYERSHTPTSHGHATLALHSGEVNVLRHLAMPTSQYNTFRVEFVPELPLFGAKNVPLEGPPDQASQTVFLNFHH